jgi:hypothetical protein
MDLSICEKKLESRRNPARIPPQTPPAGGKSAEARRIHSPRRIVSPCLVRISIFNHLDFARKTFELCPTNTAKLKNTRNFSCFLILRRGESSGRAFARDSKTFDNFIECNHENKIEKVYRNCKFRNSRRLRNKNKVSV